jgi:PAS domain S-box-containing protein
MGFMQQAFSFLAHDGELARLIAGFDWASTSLGGPESWPQSLRTTIALILQSPVPIVTLWGEEGIMIYNDAYSVFAGERHPRLLGSKVREGWPEVADFNDNVMKVGLAGGTLDYSDQQLVLNRTGKPEAGWMDLFYSPVIGEDGKPAGVIAVVVETTSKVKAEQRLRGERQRLTQMFEQAPGFMAMLVGPDHMFEMANEAYSRLVGRRDVIGLPLIEALPELADQGFRELLDRVYETGEAFVGSASRVLLERDPGKIQERFVDFIFQPVIGEDRKPVGIFVQGNDVTEQKQAENALRRETRILGVLNRLGADLAAELDLEKVVQMITDAGVEMTGAEFGAFFYNVMDEKGGSYMLYALSGVAREEFTNFPMPRATGLFQPTFKGEGVIRSDDILKEARYGRSEPYKGMPPGHLPVRSYLAAPVISNSGEVIGALFFGHRAPGMFKAEHEELIVGAAGQGAIAMDNARLFQSAERELAERRRAEEKLQALNATLEQRVTAEIGERLKAEEALRQAQKMEALGQLTGGVAHDFNNLLQVVSGNLQLLSQDVSDNARAQRRVENALAGVSRGSKLASQLLAFGRRQPLDPKVVNIGKLVSGFEDMLRRTLGEAVEIETIRSGGLWNALVDPTQVENALLNLAINARDAMESSGKLTIEVGNAFLDDSYVRQHNEVAAGQYVMLAITDTGSGMAPDIVDKVFDPFFSTKPVGKGTGLGLSMVYGFVKQSGGHVKIYSEVGQGTTVKLYFPRVHQREDMAAETDFGPITGGSETILVAEDDEQVRVTVIELLRELGYAVLRAKDAASALSVIESGVPVDLLFTDVVMPGTLKTTELARQARQRLPNLAILFTSGYTENSIVHGGRLDPGVELLSKPYTREALARKIRAVLNNQKQRGLVEETLKAVALPPEPEVEPEAAAAPSHAVLVVEDDLLIRMATVEMVVQLGHRAEEAGNVDEAIRILEDSKIDIVVTDLGLQGRTGADLAQEIARRWPGTGIIFATGQDQPPAIEADIRSAFIRKPYGPEEIVAAIDSITAP